MNILRRILQTEYSIFRKTPDTFDDTILKICEINKVNLIDLSPKVVQDYLYRKKFSIEYSLKLVNVILYYLHIQYNKQDADIAKIKCKMNDFKYLYLNLNLIKKLTIGSTIN